MSGARNCKCCNTNNLIIISIMLLLVSSLSQVTFMAEGRAILSSNKNSEKTMKVEENEEEVITRAEKMIGSRPPRCERRCGSCGHCEAIQVPVAPKQVLLHHTKITSRRSSFYASSSSSSSHTNIAYSRGDDITNYKPLSWKCKCGNFIFNP